MAPCATTTTEEDGIGPRTTDIAYPVAELAGELVWADELASREERPSALVCLGCGGRMRLHAGTVNRPHFAHHEACTAGETALHRTTCRVLAEAIESASRDRRDYAIDIWCASCEAGRTGNLALKPDLTTAVDLVLADGIRPDVLISDGDTDLYVIEVVVTHAPEDAALDLFTRRGLPVIVVRPTWDMLAELRTGLDRSQLRPNSTEPGTYELLGRCTMPRHVDSQDKVACSQCDAPALHLTVETSTVACWSDRCGGADVPVMDLYMTTESGRKLLAASMPGIDPPTWVRRKAGVNLSVRDSKQAGTRYLMHHCTDCGAPQGDNYLYGGLGDPPRTDVTRPVHQAVVCEQGHWTDLGSRRWQADSIAERPTTAASGTCGSGPGPFDLIASEALVSVQRVGDPGGISWQEAMRRMTGLGGM